MKNNKNKGNRLTQRVLKEIKSELEYICKVKIVKRDNVDKVISNRT